MNYVKDLLNEAMTKIDQELVASWDRLNALKEQMVAEQGNIAELNEARLQLMDELKNIEQGDGDEEKTDPNIVHAPTPELIRISWACLAKYDLTDLDEQATTDIMRELLTEVFKYQHGQTQN